MVKISVSLSSIIGKAIPCSPTAFLLNDDSLLNLSVTEKCLYLSDLTAVRNACNALESSTWLVILSLVWFVYWNSIYGTFSCRITWCWSLNTELMVTNHWKSDWSCFCLFVFNLCNLITSFFREGWKKLITKRIKTVFNSVKWKQWLWVLGVGLGRCGGSAGAGTDHNISSFDSVLLSVSHSVHICSLCVRLSRVCIICRWVSIQELYQRPHWTESFSVHYQHSALFLVLFQNISIPCYFISWFPSTALFEYQKLGLIFLTVFAFLLLMWCWLNPNWIPTGIYFKKKRTYLYVLSLY